jgi:hypothetical protein
MDSPWPGTMYYKVYHLLNVHCIYVQWTNLIGKMSIVYKLQGEISPSKWPVYFLMGHIYLLSVRNSNKVWVISFFHVELRLHKYTSLSTYQEAIGAWFITRICLPFSDILLSIQEHMSLNSCVNDICSDCYPSCTSCSIHMWF